MTTCLFTSVHHFACNISPLFSYSCSSVQDSNQSTLIMDGSERQNWIELDSELRPGTSKYCNANSSTESALNLSFKYTMYLFCCPIDAISLHTLNTKA